MLDWKGVASATACALLAAAGIARGDEGVASGGASQSASATQRPMLLDEAATAPSTEPAPGGKRPLMALLGLTPVGKSLDSANINLYGYVEGGYTFQFSQPPGSFIAGNVYNTQQARMKLDAVDFNIERTVDPAAVAKAGNFDVGGRIELMYGFDMQKNHSNGMEFYSNPAARSASFGSLPGVFIAKPEDQFDVYQAYVNVALPVGNGLLLTIGKFATPIGYEVAQGPSNPLYSHSYLYGYAIPFTQTGITGTYVINDQWKILAGATRGWNQSLKDNNGVPDFLGSVTWTPNKDDSVIVNVSEGPQATKDNHDYWSLIDLVATHQLTKEVKLGLNVDYGDAPHALVNKSAQWGGVAVYGSYTMNDYVTFNARGEWYDDYNGYTLGTPPYLSIYELTLGATITPMPQNDILKNFQIRPEIRGDYASGKAFDGATDRYQVQFAVDAYFNF